jgi:hypothetical protein
MKPKLFFRFDSFALHFHFIFDIIPSFLLSCFFLLFPHHPSLKQILSEAPEVECFFPNTLVNFLQSEAWLQLHAAVGDNVMTHLLLDTSMYLRFDETNAVQLTGPPVWQHLDTGLDPSLGSAFLQAEESELTAVDDLDTPAALDPSSAASGSQASGAAAAASPTAQRKARVVTRNVFYSWTRHEHFPAQHALVQATASRRSAVRVMHGILGPEIPHWAADGRLPPRLNACVEPFRQLIARFHASDQVANWAAGGRGK